MDEDATRVAVVGMGWVGTVVAACLAHLGNRVIGLEVDEAKLHALSKGQVPFHEPGLDDLVATGMRSGRLRFTGSNPEAMAGSDVVFICVGTPSGPDGHPDMSATAAAARAMAATMTHYHVVVTKSTVPIGTGRWLVSVMDDALLPQQCVAPPFSVVSNPEFLREGSAIEDFLHPDRVVLGSDDPAALEVVARLYRPILDQRFDGGDPRRSVALLRTTRTTAEMIKYSSNAFLAAKISLANEMSRLCELVGADVTEVAATVGLDARIGAQFLDAGIGWGGSCFGKDLRALVSTGADYGYDARLLRAVLDVNHDQRALVVDRILQHLHTLRGQRVTVLGLAFKPGTDDLRDAPAVDICGRLLARGTIATACDPWVRSVPLLPELRHAPDPLAAADGADAIVLATEWPEFVSLDPRELRDRMRGDLFVDGRNLFDPAPMRAAGFRYVGVGRAPVALAVHPA